MKMYNIHVNSYSGYKADEKPLDFTLEGKKYSIKNVIHQTYEKNITGELRRTYTVETDEGLIFKLCYEEIQDRWFIEDQSKETN